MIKVGNEDRPINEGSIVFVGTGVEHHFHSITEDLTVLVFFAPPRRSRALAEGAN
jgi:mannose-6-phosphate isomerase-like protein (cupin superfamily)